MRIHLTPVGRPCLAAVLAWTIGGAASASIPSVVVPGARSFHLSVSVRLDAAAPGKPVRIWIPVPQAGPDQETVLLRLDSPWATRFTSDPEFGTRVLLAEGLAAPGVLSATWRVTRAQPGGGAGTVRTIHREPRGLLALTDDIRAISAAQTAGRDGVTAKARALYDWVLSRMTYSKTGTGWGRGDSAYACDALAGNCTDFHSLFMSLAIAAGIPARFNIGYPVPVSGRGDLAGYHCWAEFHDPVRGWVPVDISEAWKRPDRRDFYFGSLDTDRVVLSRGRDVLLDPAPAVGRVNWFLEPLAEVGGRPARVTASWRWAPVAATRTTGGA
jgi:transglutaminase-like putative cysteine protease